ncbi:MAG: TatD family hydrolase [Candidatus Shapirobacteria bacterium]
MIDTHAHLSKTFCDTVQGSIGKIKEEKMKVVLAASNIEDSKENIELVKENKGILFAAIGIHPQDTDPDIKMSLDEQINLLDSLAKNNSDIVVAVGECGLDYSPAPPGEKDRDKKEQEILFKGQIEIALKYKLPLIIHARKAVDETIEILKEYKNLSGVFHCYAGGKKRIQKILDLGENWYFGIDGNLTYEDGLIEVIKNIPKDRLILETDSPYLTPEPFRGQENNPINVKYIYKKVAGIWGKSFEETEKIIDENAKRLFKFV